MVRRFKPFTTIYEAKKGDYVRYEDYKKLQAKKEKLKKALLEIHKDCGKVCSNFELCKHISCQSSYTAWTIADIVLKEVI